MKTILQLVPIICSLFITTISSAQNKTYTEIPFILSQTGQILVQASINNHSSTTYFFIEVSGKNMLRSDQPAILEKYNLDTTNRMILVDEIKIGDFVVKDTKFRKRSRLQKRGEYSFPPPVFGTLGPSFFKDKTIQFDFKTMKLRIADSVDPLSIPEDVFKIMYRSSFQNKSISLNIETRQFGDKDLIISTRSPLGVHLFYSELSPGQRSKYTDVMKRYKFRLNGEDELIFAAYDVDEIYVEHELIFNNQEIWFSDYLQNSIGINFLKNYVFTIDYKKQMLYFEPINDAGRNAISE